jgi:hypothetical protein
MKRNVIAAGKLRSGTSFHQTITGVIAAWLRTLNKANAVFDQEAGDTITKFELTAEEITKLKSIALKLKLVPDDKMDDEDELIRAAINYVIKYIDLK